MALLDFGTSECVPQISMILEYTSINPSAIGTPGGARLYLGTAVGAASKEMILANQIAAVLTISIDSNIRYPINIIKAHKTVRIDDCPSENISQYFSECIQFIEENLSEGRNVLVHCVAGISRSPAIVIAYVINYFNWSFQRAFDFVKSKRSIVNPNAGFISQLRKLDSNGRAPRCR